MPEYRKKRVNRFKPAPRRKRALPTDEDIKMTPADKRRKKLPVFFAPLAPAALCPARQADDKMRKKTPPYRQMGGVF